MSAPYETGAVAARPAASVNDQFEGIWCNEVALTEICDANEPNEPPKTLSPGLKRHDGGEESTIPANSNPSVKGGTTSVLLFWCLPLDYELLD